MLTKHLRDDYSHPFATIMAVNADMIGVAICSPKDNFSRKMGRHIAYNRAFIKSPPEFEEDFPNRKIVKNGEIKSIGEVILTEIELMKVRANKYFWKTN